jgi:hypothetical protein
VLRRHAGIPGRVGQRLKIREPELARPSTREAQSPPACPRQNVQAILVLRELREL